MNTQDILTRVNSAMQHCDPTATLYVELLALSRDLEAQIRLEIAGSTRNVSAMKVATSILKSQQSGRKCLSWAWIDAEGRQCICDGFQAYRLRNHLPLEERPADAGDPIDLNRVYPKSYDGWRKLPMPGVNEIRAWIAIEKSRRTKADARKPFEPLWNFGAGNPSVNAQYLLNAARLFPNADTVLCISPLKPIVIQCEDGDAMILPVRTTDAAEKPANENDRKASEVYDRQLKQNNEEYAAERKAKQEAERKAGEEYVQYRELVKNAAEAFQESLAAMKEVANDPHRYSAARQRAIADAEQEASMRLKAYAARTIWDEDYSMDLDEFETITDRLYASNTLPQAV